MAQPQPTRWLYSDSWSDLSLAVLAAAGSSTSDLQATLARKGGIKSAQLRNHKAMLGVLFGHLAERGFLGALDRELVPQAHAVNSLVLTAQSFSILRNGAARFGFQLNEDMLRRSISSAPSSLTANIIQQRGSIGLAAELMATLDRASEWMERTEKAALTGRAPMVLVGELKDIGEALMAIGGALCSAAAVAAGVGVTAAALPAIGAVGGIVGFVGAVDWAVGTAFGI